MSNLRFHEILLLSRRDRAARRVMLDENVTVVLGRNDTGKSALLKSIYGSFGANAAVIHPRWEAADVTSLVRFSVDHTPFSMLRSGSFYAVFEGNGRRAFRGGSVAKELAPFLADLLGYRIVLTSRNNEVGPPSPQYFFLPFYVDQDAGWRENWSSFALLTQAKEWRKSMVEFHMGIRPNEYYVAKAALAASQNVLREARSEVAVLERMVTEVRQDVSPTFDVDLESFQAQITQLLDECNRLKTIEEELSARLTEVYTRRHTLTTQIGVATASLREVASDYCFATVQLTEDSVECPTCGARYSNSFAERFAIAQDEDRLTELLVHLREELAAVEDEAQGLSAEHSNQRAEIQRINALLEQRQGEITFRTLIQAEGRKEVNQMFATRVDGARDRVTTADIAVSQQRTSLGELEDPERTDRIVDRYRSFMRSYLNELRVFTLEERTYQQITANISETGSDLPRALLAYYFSILNVMAEFSTSTFCPIVIDSPNQQGQDQESIRTMLQFIRGRRPQGSQMILAIEEPWNVDFGGSVIELTDKYHLLRSDEYDEVAAVVTPLLSQALS
jgi:hypothetical protein